jgi:hypothetical protein
MVARFDPRVQEPKPALQPFGDRDTGHKGLVFQSALSPTGDRIATASEDGTVRVWRASNPKAPPIVLKGHDNSVFSVGFHPTEPWLASASSDETLRIWRLEPALNAGKEMIDTGPLAGGTLPTDGILARAEGRELTWEGSDLDGDLKVAGGWLEPSIVLGKPRDFTHAVAGVFAPGADHVLVAPAYGRPLLYDLAQPEAPVAVLGDTEMVWRTAAFADGLGQPMAATSEGEQFTWRYFPEREALIDFAKQSLPRMDEGDAPIELRDDQLCSLGLRPFDECTNPATLASSFEAE